MMRRVLLAVAAMAIAGIAAEPDATNEIALASKTIGEVTAGMTGRVEKIVAIHAFVRDKIKNIAATYG